VECVEVASGDFWQGVFCAVGADGERVCAEEVAAELAQAVAYGVVVVVLEGGKLGGAFLLQGVFAKGGAEEGVGEEFVCEGQVAGQDFEREAEGVVARHGVEAAADFFDLLGDLGGSVSLRVFGEEGGEEAGRAAPVGGFTGAAA